MLEFFPFSFKFEGFGCFSWATRRSGLAVLILLLPFWDGICTDPSCGANPIGGGLLTGTPGYGLIRYDICL